MIIDDEVDILFKQGNRFTPAEIKSASTYTGEFLKGLQKIHKQIPSSTGNGYIIYSGEDEMKIEGVQLLNYKNCAGIVSQ